MLLHQSSGYRGLCKHIAGASGSRDPPNQAARNLACGCRRPPNTTSSKISSCGCPQLVQISCLAASHPLLQAVIEWHFCIIVPANHMADGESAFQSFLAEASHSKKTPLHPSVCSGACLCLEQRKTTSFFFHDICTTRAQCQKIKSPQYKT